MWLTKLISGEMSQPRVRLAIGHRDSILQIEALLAVTVVECNKPPPLPVRLECSMMDTSVPGLIVLIRIRIQFAPRSSCRLKRSSVLGKINHLIEIINQHIVFLLTSLHRGGRVSERLETIQSHLVLFVNSRPLRLGIKV